MPILAEIPEGAFKPQILNEFAERVKLTREELDGLMANHPRLLQRQADSAPTAVNTTATQSLANASIRSERFAHERAPQEAPWRASPARRRAVAPLAKRLLSLLLAHPELAEQLGEQQLEVLEGDDNLVLVREFVLLVQATGARHLGALIEASDPEGDLAQVLTGLSGELMAQMDLPDPRAEWEDALTRIELESLKREQADLITRGLSDQDAVSRYQELARRIHGLTAIQRDKSSG